MLMLSIFCVVAPTAGMGTTVVPDKVSGSSNTVVISITASIIIVVIVLMVTMVMAIVLFLVFRKRKLHKFQHMFRNDSTKENMYEYDMEDSLPKKPID